MTEDMLAEEAAAGTKAEDEAVAAPVAMAAGGEASANGPVSQARVAAQIAQQKAILVRNGCCCLVNLLLRRCLANGATAVEYVFV